MLRKFAHLLTTPVPPTASPEVERLRTAIRRHEEQIRLLEWELSETRRLMDRKVERLTTLVEPRC